ncbi:MAG: phosphomannomutase/phosphoglucomutase [candidate division Zixibacteria bacterium]|nr:phosphomannomutase/phosphoglucomutase [candidate division Zixibacteria bacterium]MCI0596143.1 phosphomannomutase/phosphoglucomutase [candidate division Zixibacteria bacterium]
MNFDPAIFKAYDVRGTYPEQINGDIAYQFARALAAFLRPPAVVVGRDMRLSGAELFDGLSRGLVDSGTNVIDIGLCSTDALYFAVGKWGAPAGVMITASHNPKEYNGFKTCQAEAVPLSASEGLNLIRDIMKRGKFEPIRAKGKLFGREVLPEFIQHILSFIDPQKIKPFAIAVDAGNGMAGKLIPELFKNLPCKLAPLFFELDGSFPNHPASPIEPENTEELRRVVVEQNLDLGVAFDGDADRMFLVDGSGKLLGGDVVTGLVAKKLLEKTPGTAVVYNLICSRLVPETITKADGKPIRSRVGHAYIKPLMKAENAIFGGEHSGHFYFRDNWYADSGMIALVVCLELLSEAGKPLAELAREIDPYFRSGEINFRVADQQKIIEKAAGRFADGKADREDGLTVEYADWWFNLRPSNTEPLLRLNVEANSEELLREKVALLRQEITS